MHDLRWIRDNPDEFDRGLKRRRAEPLSSQILNLDRHRRAVQTRLQEIQTRRNAASKEIGALRSKGGDAAALMDEVNRLKDAMPKAEAEEREVGSTLDALLATIPNIPAADVPDGADETANVELRKMGELPRFDFKPRDHVEIGEALGMMDFERAAKIAGARFVVLTGALARLERAISAFMLDLHTTEFGYAETSPPLLVNDETVFGTGQLPKSKDDMFRSDNLWLIPTAEVSLTNLVAGEILDEEMLPLRFTAHTACFRSEAGAAGKDTRGMLRQHQFEKVEMVSVTRP